VTATSGQWHATVTTEIEGPARRNREVHAATGRFGVALASIAAEAASNLARALERDGQLVVSISVGREQ
jgi:hypothetical protein